MFFKRIGIHFLSVEAQIESNWYILNVEFICFANFYTWDFMKYETLNNFLYNNFVHTLMFEMDIKYYDVMRRKNAK